MNARLWLIAALIVPGAAWSAPGHDHGGAPAAPALDAPRRLPSGDVFLPKATQRKLGIGTLLAVVTDAAQAVELNGRVVADPNASARVQSTQAGRLLPGPAGLPAVGRRVAKGEELAILEPSLGIAERAAQATLQADLRAQLEAATLRRARVEQLEGALPQKEIEAARLEVQALNARIAALSGALAVRESLRAPVAGVVAAVNAVAGQVVDAREILIEIVDPARLFIEALTYDGLRGADIAGASVATAAGAVPLRFVGAAAQLRDQAQPLLFAPERVLGLPVNQPVRIAVQTAARIRAVALPAAALARNPANEAIVWVHAGAEIFAPRVVRTRALDAGRVAVVDGLKDGERVVVEGAQLIGQVR
ncbi:MAG: efflux RND transporter periplasmic adaptor subunit [Burkholderiales bacterium]|nr:efflux RND transporter periplasmic adaptor subunit [Burkholderiales bacterium]